MCVIARINNEARWDGYSVDIEGTTIQYSFERAVEILAPYETACTRAICELEPIIRDHPDFYITHYAIYVRDDGWGDDCGRWVINMEEGYQIRNMFNDTRTRGSIEDAREELCRLVLAFNPALVCSEKIRVAAFTTAYSHLMLSGGIIIPVGGIYRGEPYSFERFKK
jgi:hypothetical protein